MNHNDGTEFWFEYYHIFYQSKRKAVTCLKDLQNNLKGYIQLNIDGLHKKKNYAKSYEILNILFRGEASDIFGIF